MLAVPSQPLPAISLESVCEFACRGLSTFGKITIIFGFSRKSCTQIQNQTFYQYEAYAQALQHASLRATFLGRKHANWALSHLSVNNLSVQWGHTGGPGVVEGAVQPGGSVILMPTQNADAMSVNGRRFDDLSLTVLRAGGEFCLSATNFNRWFTVLVPDELLAGFDGNALACIGPACRLIPVPLHRAKNFRSAVEELRQIVQRQPDSLTSAAAIKATARKLARTIRDAFASQLAVTPPPGRHAVPRRQIIRKAMDFVDQHCDEYLVVEDLATAAGISERTLRTAFQDYFSVGPVRYLKLRALHQIRRALKAADPSTTTVTEIVTRFGVWNSGRCAADYRLLFGEYPSETLRHLR